MAFFGRGVIRTSFMSSIISSPEMCLHSISQILVMYSLSYSASIFSVSVESHRLAFPPFSVRMQSSTSCLVGGPPNRLSSISVRAILCSAVSTYAIYKVKSGG